MAAREIPVYLFVGQLESGKTRFIQETMEDPQFDSRRQDAAACLRGGRGRIRPPTSSVSAA